MNDILVYAILILAIIVVCAVKGVVINILPYAITALAMTFVVYILTTALATYSIFLLAVLAAITIINLKSVIKSERQFTINEKFITYNVMPVLPALFISMTIFVITSIILAFFTDWMIWFATLGLMYIIYINMPKEEEIIETAKEIIEGSKAIQKKPTWWGSPFYFLVKFKEKLSREIIRTTYTFSLCSLYICTTMIITPYSLPLYTPLIIWTVLLVALILTIRREVINIALEHLKKIKRK